MWLVGALLSVVSFVSVSCMLLKCCYTVNATGKLHKKVYYGGQGNLLKDAMQTMMYFLGEYE